MDGCLKFIIGLAIVYLFITMIPVILWILIGYGIYKLGEYVYNEFNSSSRDW